jgi:hypothetical protein
LPGLSETLYACAIIDLCLSAQAGLDARVYALYSTNLARYTIESERPE